MAEEKKEKNTKVLIKLKAYESAILDRTAKEIADMAKKEGADVSGPFPLPTHKEIITILRSVHVNKDSREQFEQITHKRLIELKFAPKKVIKALSEMKIPAGVNVDLKV